MTSATAVPILFTSFVYPTNVYWSVIHCIKKIKRKPHLSVVWNWYHFVAIAIVHQPRPMDSADINTRLQLSDTSSIPPMHGGFLLLSWWHSLSVFFPFQIPSQMSKHISIIFLTNVFSWDLTRYFISRPVSWAICHFLFTSDKRKTNNDSCDLGNSMTVYHCNVWKPR